MTKQQRLYGKLVVDFANAESSDEACLKTLENIQHVFEFSSGFVERATKVFPTLSSQPKIKSKILWNKHKEIIQSIGKKLDYHYEVLDADYLKQTLTIAELHSARSDEWDPDAGEPRELPVREIAEISDKIDLETVEPLVGVWNQMYILNGHKQIDSIRKDLRDLLEQIIEGKNLYRNHLIRELLSAYDEMSKPKLVITKNGAITEEHTFSEESYLTKEAWESPHWTLLHKEPLAYCLVKHILADEKREYVRKCEECKRFYISKTRRERKFCSDKCRLKLHNRERIKSGEHAAYKRKKRKEGAKESYYG